MERELFGRASLSNLEDDLLFLENHGLLPEIYLPGEILDSVREHDLAPLIKWRESDREVSLHAPFMDLSPGGLDPRVLEVTRLRFSQVRDIVEIIRPRHVVFHPGYDKWRYGYQKDLWLNNSMGIWSEVVNWGDKLGSKILLENVFDVVPDHLVKLREKIGKSLGFCFDTGHFLLFSDISLDGWLSAMGESLAELHLHDNFGDRDSHLPIGDGIFDFPGLLSYLDNEGIAPLIVLEHHSRKETLLSLKKMRRYLENQRNNKDQSR
ncbi:sugar phosphate isomerase/epimerase [bacterium]|nr:MAG: sugar phosphate isomerase/epimerase [bacterium]